MNNELSSINLSDTFYVSNLSAPQVAIVDTTSVVPTPLSTVSCRMIIQPNTMFMVTTVKKHCECKLGMGIGVYLLYHV